MVNARVGSGIPVAHANPVSHAWTIDGRFGRVEESSRQLGGHLAVLVADEIPAPIDGCDPGNMRVRPAQFYGFFREPPIQTEFAELHGDNFTEFQPAAKPA